MLTIRRIPTVLSNYQEDDDNSENNGCGRKCLGKCCLRVSKLPLYAFKLNEDESIEDGKSAYSDEGHPVSLNKLLLGQWEDRMRQGLFRYDVTTCETKIVPGKFGFIAQLNEGRHLKKRPTEFRVDQVLQPFDENKFNFTKVGQEEVLLRFEPGKDDTTLFCPSLPVEMDAISPSVVAINVSPIEYGHVLLIPRVLDHLPQRIDHYSFLLALNFAKEISDPFFRLGYNSFGAFATINHLHFQAYYLARPFAIEKASTQRIVDTGLNECKVTVSELVDYPVRGLVYEGGRNRRDLSVAVSTACICLQNRNIPFNMLIVNCGKKIFLFPQCYAEKQALGQVSQDLLDTLVNPAVWEISGHVVFKQRKDYEAASEDYISSLLGEVSLSKKRFQEVKDCVFEPSGLLLAGVERNNMNPDKGLHMSHADQVLSESLQNCMVVQ